jgi:hypothetical protein
LRPGRLDGQREQVCLAAGMEVKTCIQELGRLVELLAPAPETAPQRSCNHHSDCDLSDLKHPGQGHCHDPECEAPASEYCDHVSPPATLPPNICRTCRLPITRKSLHTTPASDDWALLRMMELRKKGEHAIFRINWATRNGNRFLWLSIRRADGTLESRPAPDDYIDVDHP